MSSIPVPSRNTTVSRLSTPTVTACNVIREKDIPKPEERPEQFDLFTDYDAVRQEREQTVKEEQKEKSLQHAMIAIKHKFGKNAILKGSNLQEGAMTIELNQQRGGHHEYPLRRYHRPPHPVSKRHPQMPMQHNSPP